ncbi:MAG: MFS transporter [Lentisphaerae bacterium]|nr:MFS transporter [Lentisphaerota bacterium]MCP4101472.1 MFS transporter [Lentisphaerota bacterium]
MNLISIKKGFLVIKSFKLEYCNKWLRVFTASAAILLINLGVTSVNLIISSIAKDFNISLSQGQWMITSYLIGYASTVIIAGRLGDLFGHKKILITGTVIFIMASLMGSISTIYFGVIASRMLQGIGGGLVWPAATAVAVKAFPSHRRGLVTSIITSSVGLAIAAGPPLGGYFVTYLTWRWFFYFNVIMGTLVVIPSIILLKNQPEIKKSNLDIYGLVLIMSIVACIVLGIESLSKNPIHSLLLFGIFCVLMFIFSKTERNKKERLFDLELLKNKAILTGILSRSFCSFTYYPLMFIIALYLQGACEYSSLNAGFVFLPMSIVILLLSFATGRIIDKIGTFIPAVIGLIFLLVGYVLILFFTKNNSVYTICSYLIITGIGYGFGNASLLALILTSAPEEKTGATSSMTYFNALLFNLVAMLVAGVLISYCYAHYQDYLYFAKKYILTINIAVIILTIGLFLTYKIDSCLKTVKNIS